MRHSLLVCLVLLLASACWCSTVLSAQENTALGCGTHSILRNTVASALTPLAQEANQHTDEERATNTVSRSESTADTFEPIRIGLFFDSLYDDSRYCANATAKVDYGDSETVPCSKSTILTDERRSTLMNTVMPRAVELLSERVLVRRYNTAIKVPRYESTLYCGQVTIPEEHHTNGVSGYDVIFYVTAKPNNPGEGAWAIGCTDNDTGDGRPLVGLINFGPDQLESQSGDPIYIAVHELIHGLGFNNPMFHKLSKLKVMSVRGNDKSFVLTTGPMLKATMAEQFGCANRTYIDMQDDGSHWKPRTMNDDLMASVVTTGYISAITLAALEDTGMYKGVYDKAEISPWGRGAGCAFLDQPCLTDSVALPNTKFCANKDASNYHCNPKRTGLGACADTTAPSDASWASGYGQWSASSYLDYCPTYSQSSGFRCNVASDNTLDSVNGDNSKCLDATRAKKGQYTTEGVCAAVRCNADSYDVQLKNGAWTTCLDGTALRMKSESGVTRTITCPPMYEVCYVERTMLSVAGSASSRVSSVSLSFVVALCAALVSIWAAV